jgi:hypothetical protein
MLRHCRAKIQTYTCTAPAQNRKSFLGQAEESPQGGKEESGMADKAEKGSWNSEPVPVQGQNTR